MIGETFGRLTVVAEAPAYVSPRGAVGRRWLCQCSCGGQTATSRSLLVRGHTKSCGCLRSETIGALRRTHGATDTPEHRAWREMRKRCNNPRVKEYPRYGGRGITVCDQWSSFEVFLLDMGPRPTPEHSVERRDNEGHYEPGNCYWATDAEQRRNQRRSRHITAFGKTLVVKDWAELLGIPAPTIYSRLSRGLSGEAALVCI